MVKPIMHNTLRRLKDKEGVDQCYLVSRRGKVLVGFGEINKTLEDTFGTLTATIYGASLQTNKILKEKFPRRILVEDIEGFMTIRHVDDHFFIVVKYKKDTDAQAVEKELETACWTLAQELAD